MSEPLWFYKLGKHLIAADEDSEEAMRTLTQGEACLVEIKQTRNLGHHRKFFSLVRLVYGNQEIYPTVSHLLTAIKLAAGLYEDQAVTVDGKVCYLVKSISFSAMGQVEFNEFYRNAVEAVCRLLPQWNAAHLMAAAQEYAHDRW